MSHQQSARGFIAYSARIGVALALVVAAFALGAPPGSAQAATFQVTTTAGSGAGSLRAELTASDAAAPGPNIITFNIPGSGIHTISPTSSLPAITVPVNIAGATEPGFAGTPLILLDGGSAGSGATGLSITAGASAVHALEITGWSGSGVALSTKGSNLIVGSYIGTDGTSALGNGVGISIGSGSSGNTVGGVSASSRNVISGNTFKAVDMSGSGTAKNVVEGNYVGTNAAGTAGMPVSGFAISMSSGADQNVIGGTTAGARNVISVPNSIGVDISGNGTTGNLIQGNYIGTDVTGTKKIGTFVGVNIRQAAQGNTVGGTVPAARDVISGASAEGIEIHDFGTTGNVVAGDYIGTNAAATSVLGNGSGFCGVALSLDASSNTIGGSAAGSRNVISGNACGVLLTDNLTVSNTVAGNYLGTNAAGTAALPNGTGVIIRNKANKNTIGGAALGARNVLAASSFTLGSGNGIVIQGQGTTANLIQGNYIGTNATSSTVLGNDNDGVIIQADQTGGANGNTVGGTAAGDGNVIANNGFNGVEVSGTSTTANTVAGNLIGTDAHGARTLGNQFDGVSLGFGATSNTVGGTVAGARNVISGNSASGVDIATSAATGNRVEGNFIGTSPAGRATLGNTDGIKIQRGATANTVGGTAAGAGNVISGNIEQGVNIVDSGTSTNVVDGNRIGTDALGTGALGNGDAGVQLATQATNNTIGGTVAGARNVISANTVGISVANSGTTGNQIQGNFIGTDLAGTSAIGNGDGILIYSRSSQTTVGGSAPAANVISGNLGAGTKISASTSNLVQSNLIGVAFGGTTALGNAGDGVLVFNGSTNTTVGGTAAGQANQIAHNRAGIEVNGTASHGDQLPENSIFLNGPIGAGPGITLTAGGNGNQAPPTITSATTTKITGTIGPGSYRIEVFANPSCTDPEARKFVSAVNTSSGSWTVTVSPALSPGQGVTSSATNSSTQNTSRLSGCKSA